MEHYLDCFIRFVTALRSTNSRLDKEDILRKFWQESLRYGWGLDKLFHYVYDYDKQYYITSANILKFKKKASYQAQVINNPWHFADSFTLWDLLDELSERVITGNLALTVVNEFLRVRQFNDEQQAIILNIIDKDLKCGLSEVTINKVCGNIIKTYDVALADKFNPKKHILNSDWVIEQKYDGIRVNCIFYNKDNIKFFSRKGKEIKTLDFLKPSILKLNLPNNTVIDGEICDIRNGQENFSSIVSYIHKGVKK